MCCKQSIFHCNRYQQENKNDSRGKETFVLNKSHPKTKSEHLVIALDYATVDEANDLMQRLEGIPCYMKVGLQLFYAAGPMFIQCLKQKGYRVFLDVKMHDIPNTVLGAAYSVTRLGVDMFTVHASGGIHMMRAAWEGVQRALVENPSLKKPSIVAVTQLTSTNEQMMKEEIGILERMEQTVVRYASMAKSAGLDGVVCSPLETFAIRTACGTDFQIVTPGIRLLDNSMDDQQRVCTPSQAIRGGSNYIVVGRPITHSPNPREVVQMILKEMNV